MSNHIHLIGQALNQFNPGAIQAGFMKYTAQQIKRTLQVENPDLLETFRVNKYDRDYQIRKREPLSVELFSEAVFQQKLDNIHNNPVRAGLRTAPEEYYYSSAKFYHNGIDDFGMFTNYRG